MNCPMASAVTGVGILRDNWSAGSMLLMSSGA
jgi:hypothetical protein